MRALDGTYWTWRWAPGSFARLEVATKQEVLDSYGKAMRMGRPARFRPRMSIVKAVRLLTEARKHGVELWMRSDPEAWGWLSYDDRGWTHMLPDGRVVKFNLRPWLMLEKWIVATPEDARRIDARGKK